MSTQDLVDAARLQRVLDVLGNVEGGILLRGPDRWIVLPPGNIGDVLVIGEGGVPEWADPSTITFG